MKSFVAVTSEIDDLEFAVSELSSQMSEKLILQKNSIAIVHCDADVEVAELGGLLHEKLGIEVVGVTSTACIDRYNGYHDIGITLCILTAEDVNFAIGSTDNLVKEGRYDNYKDTIRNTYANAQAEIGEDPKLIYILSPFFGDMPIDTYIDILDEVSGGAPIFGGVATDHYDLVNQKTFYNGSEFDSGLVFVLIGGNVKPIFAMEHSFGKNVEKKGIVTKSHGSYVERIGDQTFKEFVSSIVPVPDEELVVYHFQSTPFIVEMPDYGKDEQPVARCVCTINRETGVGGFNCSIPEGSTIYLNIFQRDNLDKSCIAALKDIIDRVGKDSDYEYSMFFIITCNARHLLMGDMKKMESELLHEYMEDVSPNLNAMGYYGFGEFCPTGVRENGNARNRFHNIAFAVCAI